MATMTTAEQLELIEAIDNTQKALEDLSDDLISWPSHEVSLSKQPHVAAEFAKLMVLINRQKAKVTHELAPAAPAANAGEPLQNR